MNLPRRSSSSFSFQRKRKKRPLRPRDLWPHSFKNPFTARKSFLPRRTKAPKIKIALGLLAIIALGWIFFFHPYFSISAIEIKGAEKISAAEMTNLVNQTLDKKRFWIFNGQNLFWADLDEVTKEISRDYVLEELKLKTRWPDGLIIALKEKQAVLLAQNSIAPLNNEPKNTYFLIDKEGKIIQRISETDINQPRYLDLLLVKFQKPELKINEELIPPATVEFLNYLRQKIPEKTKITLNSAVLADEEGRVIHLTAGEGWKIIVDRQNDWEKQLQVLTIFLRDKIKDNRKNLHYIDVRYENRSYYQ